MRTSVFLKKNADGDVLQYKVKEYHENTTISKRHILADTAAIFDPMGLVGPITIQAKLIIQSLWQIRIGCRLGRTITRQHTYRMGQI